MIFLVYVFSWESVIVHVRAPDIRDLKKRNYVYEIFKGFFIRLVLKLLE